MTTARRRRTISAIALSAVVHAAVLTVLWVQRPSLPADLEPAGPPEAIIPVLILPRAPPPAAGAAAPAPIRLHRRSQRFAAEPPPIAPLPVPEPKAAPPPAQAPAPPSPLPPPPLTREVRTALRLGPVGCANADALNLSRAEREACEEKFAAGARDAPYIAPPLAASKRAELQAAAARKDALMRARETPLGTGNTPRTPEPQDYDGEPYITGAGASALGQATHPASKRAAKKLQPLPP